MKLSKHFNLSEFTRSRTAKKLNIDNSPNEQQTDSLIYLVKNLLEPLRYAYGKPIHINSGYRSRQLNFEIGGSNTSDHPNGCAADIDTVHDNKELFNLIKDNFEYDQLIAEYEDNGNPAWIHVSLKRENNRNEKLIKLPSGYFPYSEELFNKIYNGN